jgi:hypothetical protein
MYSASHLHLVPRDRQAKIDRFGEVDRCLNLWQPQANPHLDEHQRLKAEILSWADSDPAEKSTVLSGRSYQVEITARGFQRKFSAEANALAHRLLSAIKGLDLMQFFSITLGDAKTHLGKPWLEKHVPKQQTGPRTVNVVPLAEAKVLAKRVA